MPVWVFEGEGGLRSGRERRKRRWKRARKQGQKRNSAKQVSEKRKKEGTPFPTRIRRKVLLRSASKEYSRRDTFFRADTKGEKTDGADKMYPVGFLFKNRKKRKIRHGRGSPEHKDCRRHEGARALFYTHDGCRDEGEAVACGAVKARNQRTNR